MMKHRSAPAIADDVAYDWLVAAKRGRNAASLQNIRGQVVAAYPVYIAAAPNSLHVLPALGLGPRRKRALEHLYEKKTKNNIAWRTELERVISLGGPFCAYCNMGAHEEFDHYLPISLFPEFAVYSKNLVPACGPCNKKKTATAGGANRVYSHPYYDAAVDPQWLTCSVVLAGHLVVSEFHTQAPPVASAEFELFQRQCTALAVCERFEDVANQRLDEYRDGFVGVTLVERNTRLQGERPQYTSHGAIYWRTLLIDALLANQAALAAL